jgi:hypothetical protein
VFGLSRISQENQVRKTRAFFTEIGCGPGAIFERDGVRFCTRLTVGQQPARHGARRTVQPSSRDNTSAAVITTLRLATACGGLSFLRKSSQRRNCAIRGKTTSHAVLPFNTPTAHRGSHSYASSLVNANCWCQRGNVRLCVQLLWPNRTVPETGTWGPFPHSTEAGLCLPHQDSVYIYGGKCSG